jgi:hypothetical protein
MNRRACAILLTIMMLCCQTSFPQNTQTSKSKPATSGSNTESAAIKDLEANIDALTKLESDPRFANKAPLDAEIHRLTCKRNTLVLEESLVGSAQLKKTVSDNYNAACIQASPGGSVGSTGSNTSGNSGVVKTSNTDPPVVKLPSACPGLTAIKQNLALYFNTQEPADNSAIPVNTKVTPLNRKKQVRLNANSSGGEINTKGTVYVEYISRLRYSATLGGVVTSIAAPNIPSSIYQTVPTFTPATGAAAKPKTTAPSAPSTPTTTPPENSFQQFNDCFADIQEEVAVVQSSVLSEEVLLNSARGGILNQLNNVQPVVGTLPEAASINLRALPSSVIPAFPIGAIEQLREVISEFILRYVQFNDWAHKSAAEGAIYDSTTTDANQLAGTLDQYLGITDTTSLDVTSTPKSVTRKGTSAPTAGTGTSSTVAATKGADSSSSSGKTGTTEASASSCPALTVGSKEVGDYEANRCFVEYWRTQFRTVAGEASAGDVDYFVVDYKPLCGGFFGAGTSTQMQLTVVDILNPTDKPVQTNLDKVVCEPALSISSGLGLSFVSDKTPAFVPTVEKNSQGNPILDSNGNPVIVQSLGYSSQANVRPGYALQVNTSLWSPREPSFEFHWSVGAMLTSATGGVTTDILTGPTFSFKKRSIFISPMYDLGLRTTYVPPFTVGMPQGNLTSPPTHQVWKSGFGLTLTFPFSTSTNSTESSNSSGKSGSTGGAKSNTTGGSQK